MLTCCDRRSVFRHDMGAVDTQLPEVVISKNRKRLCPTWKALQLSQTTVNFDNKNAIIIFIQNSDATKLQRLIRLLLSSDATTAYCVHLSVKIFI